MNESTPVAETEHDTAIPWHSAAIPVHWTPLAAVLHKVPLTSGDWLIVLVLAAMPAIIGQTVELATSISGQRLLVETGAC